MNIFEEEYSRAQNTIKFVTDWLSGECELYCLDQEPSRKYSVGIITPLSEDETNLSEEKQRWLLKRRPNSIGFEARIIPSSSEIILNVNLNFSVYYRSIPTFQEQREGVEIRDDSDNALNSQNRVHFRQKFKKEAVSLTDLPLKISLPKGKSIEELDCTSVTNAVNEALNTVITKVIDSTDCWVKEDQESTIPFSALKTETDYLNSIPKGEKERPKWEARVTAKVWSAEDNQWRLNILLTNVTDTTKSQHQSAFFNTKIETVLKGASFVSVPFEAAKRDYRYNTQSWGKGINAVLRVNSDSNTAETVTVPIYEQARIITRSILDKACNFERLSTDDFYTALGEIQAWLSEYCSTWESNNKNFIQDSSYESRQEGVHDFRNEIKRYELGIEALKADKRLELSFKLMNSAFAKGKKKGFEGWRLFQLVFIVTQMSSLVAREIAENKFLEELKKVDVLWFPTGGGKTEAYFGVILTAMFYDRLRGKNRGVTAWLRYPLRMLSIQQLQRLVDIIVLADEIRTSTKIKELVNSDSFSVGYYVGSANTPNELTYHKNSKYPDPILLKKTEVEKASNINDTSVLVLQRCPFCKSVNITVEVNIPEIRIKHICKDCHKEAPIYISDSEVYRYAPTVIVGTVDRLARAGQKSLFSHLFGKFTHQCPKHGYLSFGSCIEPKCDIPKSGYIQLDGIHDPVPALLLQDELHLLKESLGTYDSHYETFIDLLAEKTGIGLHSKRLAATATIEGYKEHVWELYGREGVRFPVKGMEENDTAYIQPSELDKIARIYVGVMPTGASPEETVASILKILKQFSQSQSNVGGISKNIVDNYDLSLAYVNEKNTAGNIRSRWEELSDIQVLTGDKGLGEVRAVIGRVETDENREFNDRLRAIVATSVISHGVDLSRLNYMTFCGMPNHASDYIQASSRVGRSHLGVVLTVFRPDNNRERNIYQRFYEYHERLYQLVQPVPINRFSESSVERTLSGILCACILNILSYEKQAQTRIPFDYAPFFISALNNGIVSDDELISLVKKAYMLEELSLPGTTVAFFEKLIGRLVREQRRILRDGEHPRLFMRMIPPPVSSLREVSEQIEFAVSLRQEDMLEKIIGGRKA